MDWLQISYPGKERENAFIFGQGAQFFQHSAPKIHLVPEKAACCPIKNASTGRTLPGSPALSVIYTRKIDHIHGFLESERPSGEKLILWLKKPRTCG
ncbi:MAG: hypothetical protein RIF32_17365 [Leptospirales bacterium]|jgi:hypothetical protein